MSEFKTKKYPSPQLSPTPQSSSAKVFNRRDFLSASGLVASITSAGVLLPALDTPAHAFHTTQKQTAARYHKSAHIERFYQLNRR
ncbi:hypothetical protein [Entomobacter blattae]|uniref:Formate dehydrogenase n=1 Tax=Entomobacter blattae TaxID=2762277 RepID=A0A7H1NT24_9PROT|nr:hypothetical protein [Entomobacter blattae]QNT78934.1 hypothetical protein JGUZn3_17160 [Entomobacter blattae]